MSAHNVYRREMTPELEEKPRVFLSHRQADKEAARLLAHYFEFLALHYYFDEADEVLQQAASAAEPDVQGIVDSIEAGLAHCTHLLAVLSEKTMGSWWVPFEIGSARARGAVLAFLALPPITPPMLPEYMRICTILWTPQELFGWAAPLASWPSGPVVRSYSSWREEESGGPFAELGPDEELIDLWRSKAERDNEAALAPLAALLAR